MEKTSLTTNQTQRGNTTNPQNRRHRMHDKIAIDAFHSFYSILPLSPPNPKSKYQLSILGQNNDIMYLGLTLASPGPCIPHCRLRDST